MSKVERKYVLLKNDSVTLDDGRTLFRIQAVRNVFNEKGKLIVEKGDLGGFVERDDHTRRNLSHAGGCWIAEDAMAYGASLIMDDAILCDQARIHGHAMLFDDAIAQDECEIGGHARVYDGSRICADAHVSGYARVRKSRIDYDLG